MEEAFTQWLLENFDIANVVGDRITWTTIPQGQLLPAIVLTRVSRSPEYSVDLLENKLTMSRIQVDCWGLIYSDAKAAGRAVFKLLSAATNIVAGIEFQAVYADSESDSFEQGTGNRDLWRNSQDFMIWHAAT